VALLITAPGVQANTGAGATILNTVQVNYYDAGGTQLFQANATTTTTVNLVKAGLSYSGMPTSGSPGKTAAMPANQTVDSGSTASYIIALTANANGGDTYNLSRTIGATLPVNMISDTVTYSTVRNDGSTVITGGSPGTVALGASVIQAVPANNQISIPGNSNLAALITLNSAGYKVLVVHGIDYIVTGITGGTAPSNTHVGNTYYNDLGTATGETLAVITLAANASGSNTTPAFLTDGTARGQVVAEQILVKVDVTGVVGPTAGTDGTVDFYLTTSDSSSGNSANTTPDIRTTFRASNLQVQKNVRNCGPTGGTCGSWGASATGNPLDILEYQVLVNNAGGSVAKLVTGTDAVPVYTTLMCYTGSYLGADAACAAGTYFATITNGANTSQITNGSADNECAVAPLNVGAGRAAGSAETSALNFYMGTTCNGITPVGGNVTNGQLYTILYRVKMN
jgi:hypothetical protein